MDEIVDSPSPRDLAMAYRNFLLSADRDAALPLVREASAAASSPQSMMFYRELLRLELPPARKFEVTWWLFVPQVEAGVVSPNEITEASMDDANVATVIADWIEHSLMSSEPWLALLISELWARLTSLDNQRRRLEAWASARKELDTDSPDLSLCVGALETASLGSPEAAMWLSNLDYSIGQDRSQQEAAVVWAAMSGSIPALWALANLGLVVSPTAGRRAVTLVAAAGGSHVAQDEVLSWLRDSASLEEDLAVVYRAIDTRQGVARSTPARTSDFARAIDVLLDDDDLRATLLNPLLATLGAGDTGLVMDVYGANSRFRRWVWETTRARLDVGQGEDRTSALWEVVRILS